MNADGSGLTEIRREPRDVTRAPMSWTRDGRRIVFWGAHAGTETLLSMRPDGTSVRMFVRQLPASENAPVLDWSPDGRWMVIGSVREFRFQTGVGHPVYLMRPDGSEIFTIVAPYGGDPTWGPEAD